MRRPLAACRTVLSEQEGELDDDSCFCVAWYERYGTNEGDYGIAETLLKAKNTSVRGLEQAGVLTSRGGKLRLLKRSKLPEDWNPQADVRMLLTWECTQHLVRAVLEGEEIAALVRKLGLDQAEGAR